MHVSEKTRLTTELDGKDYYFCSSDCLVRFLEPEKEKKKLLQRVIIGWLLTIPILIFTYLINETFYSIIFMIIASSIVLFYSGIGYFKGALMAIAELSGNMDLLVSMGSFTAFLFSLYLSILMIRSGIYNSGLYFDSASFIISIILTGSYIESVTKERAYSASNTLAQLIPDMSKVLDEGKLIEVETGKLIKGQIVVLGLGDTIPVDGEVMEGNAELDQSFLTGEQRPVRVFRDSSVLAGSRIIQGSIKIRAEKIGRDSTIGYLQKILENASMGKVGMVNVADTFSKYFVPVVLLVSLISFTFWGLVTGFNISVNPIPLLVFISIIIIACPCAIGLAIPVTLLVFARELFKRKIILKNNMCVGSLSKTNTVILDKTGTLTGNDSEINLDIKSGERKDLISIMYGMEMHSDHPVGKAIVNLANQEGIKPCKMENIEEITGFGILAKRGLEDWELMREGENTVLKCNGSVFASFSLSWNPREGAKQIIDELNGMGIKTLIMSGDSKAETEKLALMVGIENYYYDMTPEQKSRKVMELQEKGDVITYVGDGINDSVSLEMADSSISLGNGTEVAKNSSDIIISDSDIRKIPSIIRISRATLKKGNQNIFWAMGYNTVLIPVAAGVLVPLFTTSIYSFMPMLSATAMGMSSVTVVLNSLFLGHKIGNIERKEIEHKNF
jgi:Cu2+-exporting ATPase/Cu+-exporting ATPase